MSVTTVIINNRKNTNQRQYLQLIMHYRAVVTCKINITEIFYFTQNHSPKT